VLVLAHSRRCVWAPLEARAFQRGAAEQFLILLVGETGVGNGYLAPNAFEQSGLGGVRAGLEFFLNLGVNERVDAAYEKLATLAIWLMS